MKVQLLIALGAIVMVSCAASNGAKKNIPNAPLSQTIYLTSDPVGASVLLNGKVICQSTPAAVEVPFYYSRGGAPVNINLLFIKKGYEPVSVPVKPEMERSGQKYRYPNGGIMYAKPVYPYSLHCTFGEPIYQQDPTIPIGEAKKQVTRNNPGSTALEKTIIRWFFDSEPRGARIYWRIISSVPDQVKNTNELYLGTTPFEETRSFNILGLTYENSRDIQIEVKVCKPGYMDQIKRFNVRQAIDQQEISSFYDLVIK